MSTKPNSNSFVPRRWWIILPLGLLVLLLAHGMALLYRIQPAVSLWFPPSGVAIALTLWFGPIGVVLTAVASILIAPLWGNDGWTQIVGLTDATEPLVAWWLYRRRWKGSLSLSQLRDAAAFTLSAPLAACATSAVIGSLALVAVGKMSVSSLALSIPHWWLGNAIGTIAIAPTALLVLTPFLQSRGWLPQVGESSQQDLGSRVESCPHSTPLLWAEVTTILVLSVSTAAIAVSKTHVADFAFQQLSFLSFVPIIWAASRFGVTGGMLTSTFCVLVTLFAYLLNYPHAISLPSFPVQAEVLHVHKLSLLVQCAVSLFVGCAITERAATQVALAVERVRAAEHQAQAKLAEQLMQLNDELKTANHRLEQSNRDKEELLHREQLARAESEVARSAAETAREQSSKILESITDGFVAFNRDWCFTYLNREAARTLGFSPKELLGKNVWKEFPEFCNTSFGQVCRQAIAEGVPLELEDYYPPLTAWFAVRAYPSEAGLSIYFRSVTERRQAEETLRQSEERLRLALDAGQAGVWDWDILNNHITWSERIYKFHGVVPGTFGSKPEEFTALIHPEDRERVFEALQTAINEKASYQIEFRIVQPSGAIRWLSTNGRVIYDPTGKPVRMLGATIDTTERKVAEEEREQLLVRERSARAHAEAASRIKDEFQMVLSHELRTPVNLILGWAKILRSRKCDAATTDKALETIERNAKLQTQLVEDLLDISRILQGKLRLNVSTVNLGATIQSVIETVGLAAQAKSIQIQTVFDPNVGSISGDADRLQQVVWNLLSNAVKFTPVGGRVDIQLCDLGGYAQIRVSDTGSGINSEFLPFVFDYFRQADSTTTRAFGGLGVGLTIVRYLVELHGGTVQAESPGEGLGSTFTVTLPAIAAVPQTNDGNVLPENSLNLDRLKMLVVDDELDTLELLAFMLEQYGAQVVAVTSANEALVSLGEWQPDVLLSDIGMPEVDGYMLIRQIRAMPPEQGGLTKAIALTAYAGDTDHQQILEAGFQKHVTKPVDPVSLARLIASLVKDEG